MVSKEHRDFAVELARQSGDFIRPFFADPDLIVEQKADQTAVTAADRGAEELMRALIKSRFPNHGILGEEFGPENTDAEFVWVLDPVDGTISFAAGVPLFGTLIALQHRGQPVLGVIHQPILDQLVVGDGNATTLNGRMVRTRNVSKPEEGLMLATGIKSVQQHQDPGAFHALVRQVRTFRGWGDCYGYLMLATGRADIMCDPIMNPWDIAALIPVVRGAGGVITDWQGGDPSKGNSIVAAATPELHARVIATLNG